MSTAADQTTISYPTPPELIGEPAAVVQEPEVDDDQVDEQETAPHSGYYETTAPEVRAPRRRHRWDLLGGSFTVGDEGSTIQRFRCRHCGLQARKVPTRNGRGLRLEVLPDGDTDWTAEVAPCPGASDWRIPDDVTPEVSRIRKLEDLVEQLQAEAGAFLREIEIRGQLLDRVKVATGETWWHGAVERVEQLQAVAIDPQGGNYRSLVAGWHRKAQEVDHWQAKYERQLKHSKRVEYERNQANDRLAEAQADLAYLREERRRIQWGSTALADEAEQELRDLRAELATLRAAPVPVPIGRRPLPQTRSGRTLRFDIGLAHGYITVGEYDDGTLGELFVIVAKEGGPLRGMLDSWARLFSVALQHGVDLADLVRAFRGSSFEPSGWSDVPGIGRASSIPDLVVRWLEQQYLPPAPSAEAEQPLGAQP